MLAGLNLHLDVQIARWAAPLSGVAAAGKSYALTVIDSLGNFDLKLAAADEAPASIAGFAASISDLALAIAGFTGAPLQDLAEGRIRDGLNDARALAAIAAVQLAAGLSAAAVTVVAAIDRLERDRRRLACCRLGQRDCHGDDRVVTLRWPALTSAKATSEESAEEIAE
jgi:hypothetical protein